MNEENGIGNFEHGFIPHKTRECRDCFVLQKCLETRDEQIKSLESRLKEAEEKIEVLGKDNTVYLKPNPIDFDFQKDAEILFDEIKMLKSDLKEAEAKKISAWEEVAELNARLSHLMDVAIKIVEAEPELPGRMPDEMWKLLKGNRDMTEKAQQQAVMLTKRNIIKALLAEWDGIKE